MGIHWTRGCLLLVRSDVEALTDDEKLILPVGRPACRLATWLAGWPGLASWLLTLQVGWLGWQAAVAGWPVAPLADWRAGCLACFSLLFKLPEGATLFFA